jgi:hypothetical protein
MPRSPRSVYYRSLRRVQRRAVAFIAAERSGHAFRRARAHALLVQACRLTNRLALIDDELVA